MRRDWSETITVAADVALVGLFVTVASVPLVTLGAAVRTGSSAVGVIARGEKVSLPAMWRLFRASLVRGLVASLAAFALVLLLVYNVGAVAGGRVPGGSPALAGTGVAVVVLLAIGMLTLVRLGRDTSPSSWREALRWAARTAWRQPGAAAAVAGVSAVAAALALFVPLTAPLLVGYALYAAHAVTTRLVKSPSPA
ncbi:hypothetical protein [Dactylosporangium matsuzakiense]|uniref:Uncharacterized protein n=1 Tax=Dactylosporangium matsuzakiense TaxID=53360 RepID=A0A9W6KQU1_9ACTN|nr:hypothetical protein [Dactylosporangium matsuzakiense]UWZ42684.1 hypothetical protein Dmats_34860 [Dactylosporangium matsuzakiense]GLL03834.1 hypothetical protein GCM10017581_055800 [Dactylosporangium matsuzakiense]